MRKARTKSTSRTSAKTRSLQPLREVTVDDVIRDLLDLFDHLGLDASRLADRLVDVDAAATTSRRLYPYASAIGELLSAWHQDPEYLDPLGSPKPIRMRGGHVSFHQLANKNVP